MCTPVGPNANNATKHGVNAEPMPTHQVVPAGRKLGHGELGLVVVELLWVCNVRNRDRQVGVVTLLAEARGRPPLEGRPCLDVFEPSSYQRGQVRLHCRVKEVRCGHRRRQHNQRTRRSGVAIEA